MCFFLKDSFGDIATFEYNASGIRTSKTFFTNAGCNCDADCNCDEYFTTKFLLNGTKIIKQEDYCNTLDFFYGADGVTGFHIFSKSTNGETLLDKDYYYKKNIQGDIIGLYDDTGLEIARYFYDAWGNHKIQYLNTSTNEFVDIEENYVYNDVSNINRFVAYKNPFRYRSYYYDFETKLYYLNSRYYDPETGRFINADDVSILAESKDLINGLNLFAYCNDNPVVYYDPNGKFFWFLLPFLLSGLAFAVGNTLVQLGSDLVNLLLTGEWTSSWEDYLGAFVGGFAGGIAFVLTGFNLAAAFATIGFTETLVTNLATNLTGKTNFSLSEILFTTAIMTLAGLVTGKIFGGTRIKGITKGRNSYFAVFKSAITKLRNQTIKRISMKTFLKGIVSFPALKLSSIFINGSLPFFLQ